MSQHDSPRSGASCAPPGSCSPSSSSSRVGAAGVAIWAASAVRQAVDQRDLLQARVAELEARPAAPRPRRRRCEEVTPAPAEEPAPVVEDVTPPPQQPQTTPVPPVVRTQPPVRQPPVRNPPPYRPPVYTPPPVYQPPVYTPPPRVDDKPPVTATIRRRERPRRPRRRSISTFPGCSAATGRRASGRTAAEQPEYAHARDQFDPEQPDRPQPEPAALDHRPGTRPPAAPIPNPTTVIRRRPRPTTNDNPQPPAVR